MRLIHLAIALALATAGFADTVTLKSGRVIHGTYLGGTARQLRVDTGDRVETLDVGCGPHRVWRFRAGAHTRTARNRPIPMRIGRGCGARSPIRSLPSLRPDSDPPPAPAQAAARREPVELRRAPTWWCG